MKTVVNLGGKFGNSTFIGPRQIKFYIDLLQGTIAARKMQLTTSSHKCSS